MVKTDILLMLLFADEKASVVGTTRLQKMLFLIEHEKKIKCDEGSFDFVAYKFGPVSKTLYDDLEFLVNIGFLEKTGEDSKINIYSLDDLDNIDAKDLITEIDEEDLTEDEDGREISTKDDLVVYKITDEGIKYLKENNLTVLPEAKNIENIKKKYGKKPLIELLRYVYMKYPKYTTDSEIKDEIL